MDNISTTKFYLILLLTLFAVGVWFFLLDLIRVKNKEIDNKQLELLLKINPSEYINILDSFIQDIFSEYIILNIEFKYEIVNSKVESIILKDVSELVFTRMSPLLYKKMRIIYSEDQLADIITKKVDLLCIDYSMKKKTPHPKE